MSSEGGQISMGSIWVGVWVCIPYVASVVCRRALSAMNTICTVMSLVTVCFERKMKDVLELNCCAVVKAWY